MAASSQQYCLRWNNHRSNLLNVFDELLQNEAFTDVTLAVDDGSIKCHKMVLVACSSYFQNLFLDLPCKHPIVILKDVKLPEIKAILEYMYRGEVNVAQEHLGVLLKVAEVLKVKGLVDGSQTPGPREEAETSTSPPPAISTSTGTAAHSSGPVSPPHSTCGPYNLYGSSRSAAIDRGSQDRYAALSMWQLSKFPLHHATGHQSSSQSTSHAQHPAVLGGTSYDSAFEISPHKRKKMLQHPSLLMNRDTPILRTVLGQGHADSSQTGIPLLHSDSHEVGHFRSSSNGSANDNDRRSSTDLIQGEAAHSPYTDVSTIDEDEKQQRSPQSYPGDSKSGMNYMPVQKPEWKRYKQYTRDDITAAIEAVKAGMSAVQAARKHGVPSRTLYDKVKKLGITTSRPFKRASNGSSGACFPYGIGGNVNGSIYNSASCESENENSNANENAASITLETVYAKVKDMSQDRGDSTMSDVARCSPSPVIRCAKQQQQEQSMDEVEDLSVSRKPDVPVIIPTTSGVIKEEAQDVGPDDCCDYN